MMSFVNLSNKEKQMKISECSIQWPCRQYHTFRSERVPIAGVFRHRREPRNHNSKELWNVFITVVEDFPRKPLATHGGRAQTELLPITKRSGPLDDSGEVHVPLVGTESVESG